MSTRHKPIRLHHIIILLKRQATNKRNFNVISLLIARVNLESFLHLIFVIGGHQLGIKIHNYGAGGCWQSDQGSPSSVVGAAMVRYEQKVMSERARSIKYIATTPALILALDTIAFSLMYVTGVTTTGSASLGSSLLSSTLRGPPTFVRPRASICSLIWAWDLVSLPGTCPWKGGSSRLKTHC